MGPEVRRRGAEGAAGQDDARAAAGRLGRVLDEEVEEPDVSLSTSKQAGRPTRRGARPAPLKTAGPRSRKPVFTVRRSLGIAGFMAPAALFVAVFIYYPMISGSQMAFRNWNLNDLTDTSWVGIKNFQTIFN